MRNCSLFARIITRIIQVKRAWRVYRQNAYFRRAFLMTSIGDDYMLLPSLLLCCYTFTSCTVILWSGLGIVSEQFIPDFGLLQQWYIRYSILASTGWPKQFGTIFARLNFTEILTDFQNYFTARIRRKFAIKIPPHLNCVATLPCEMSSVLKATIENKDDFCNNTF